MREKLKGAYAKYGLTIFLAGSGIILFYFLVSNLDGVKAAFDKLTNILMPFILGLVMAYIVCPIYNGIVRRTYRHLAPHIKKKHALAVGRVLGSVIVVVIIIAVFGAFIALMVPQIMKSIMAIVEILPGRVQDLSDWATKKLIHAGHKDTAEQVKKILDNSYSRGMKLIQKYLMPGVGNVLTAVSQGVIMTIRAFLNFLIGIIVCVYFLNSKERFKAEVKKIIISSMNHEHADGVFNFANFCNRTFGGFISGKIIDSIIIGIICYVVMSLMHLPYTALVSTIVGVTNIIPFFGPFIGAIPSAIIICVINPLDALYFLIMIFFLQQFDGNILGPKILGESTGLASFWVMFAIIVAGGLFGFVGMILGVPVFAVIYYYFKKYIEKRLRNKGLEFETRDYMDFNKYDVNREDVLDK